MSQCTCIADFDADLDGQKLDTSIVFSRTLNTMELTTYTRIMRTDTGREENRRSKPRIAIHSFCPFCGIRKEPLPAEGGAE